MASTMPLSARSNHAANAAAVHVMPGGGPLTSRPKNPLLVRDGVGRAKPSCYDLPHEAFSYGRPGNHDVEGAREVSMHWVSHQASAVPQSPAPDFLWFNKRAATAKVSNAKDLSLFRKEMEAVTPRSYGNRTPRSSTAPVRSRGVVPSDIVPGFTYGKKIRPSTPIDEVITHRFADKSESELMRFYTEYRTHHEQAVNQVRKISQTTASRGHGAKARKANQELDETKDLFKIRKFKNVGCKINNGRYKPSHEKLLDRMAVDDAIAADAVAMDDDMAFADAAGMPAGDDSDLGSFMDP
mmetsp:Transcript_35568/g.62830  ORF Transcript_35568/g.62830 Transcript_35568/m.62830 type:complete len:297 (-) Transcript_35568:99-989(-)